MKANKKDAKKEKNEKEQENKLTVDRENANGPKTRHLSLCRYTYMTPLACSNLFRKMSRMYSWVTVKNIWKSEYMGSHGFRYTCRNKCHAVNSDFLRILKKNPKFHCLLEKPLAAGDSG